MVEQRVQPLFVVHLRGDFWKTVMMKLMVSNVLLMSDERIYLNLYFRD